MKTMTMRTASATYNYYAFTRGRVFLCIMALNLLSMHHTLAFSIIQCNNSNRINLKSRSAPATVSTSTSFNLDVEKEAKVDAGQIIGKHDIGNNVDNRKPVEKCNLEPLKLKDGSRIAKFAYRQGLPPSLTRELRNLMANEYDNSNSVNEMFRILLTIQSLEPGETLKATDDSNGNQWNIQRPRSHWANNMHWIAPANEIALNAYNDALTRGGFDQVLEELGKTFNLTNLGIHHMFFVGVSNASTSYTHIDFDDTDGKGFTMLIPLRLPSIDGVDCELGFQNDDRSWYAWYKYKEHEAALVGDGVYHVTADCDYSDNDEFRICANIYVCDKSHPINKATNEKGVYSDGDIQ